MDFFDFLMPSSNFSILYLGSLSPESNSLRRLNALKDIGNRVEAIDSDPFIYNSVFKLFHYNLNIGPGVFKFNREVIRVALLQKPDIILVDNRPFLTLGTLKILKKKLVHAKIINILTDDPGGSWRRSWRLSRSTCYFYDFHFVQREINIPELLKRGANRVELCFRSFDKNYHKHLSLSSSDKEKYACDIGFIGTYEREREAYIAFLIENGIKVSIWGNGWPEGKYWSIIKSYYKGPSVYGDEYVKIINGMSIALHFLRKINRDQQDSRTFEIPACKTFMLAERSWLHKLFFIEGEEAVFFTSKEELLSKLRYYLNNPNERNRIANAGYNRCLSSGYDHFTRMREVLNTVSNSTPIKKKIQRIVASIYIDPDFYPPTINAVLNLAEKCDELILVTRNNSLHDFPFPGNVRLIKIGKLTSVQSSEKKHFINKSFSFLQFSLYLLRFIYPKRTDIVIFYDSIPLFSFLLIRRLVSKKKVCWYHNHDMPNIELLRPYSIGWFAAKFEKKAMKYVDLFTLPSNDRLQFYPNCKGKRDYFCLPNYPSLKAYPNIRKSIYKNEEIRIIFQGSIGEFHSLEEMVTLLKGNIFGRPIRLILKGGVRQPYKQSLNELAADSGVSERLSWVGLGPYCELQSLTSSCHIGLAIHLGDDDVRKTLGTASNKIYEYAASGLPVILYDIDQFRKYLDNYSWAFFCDGSMLSLKKNIELILNNYESISIAARKSFEDKLNFEKEFDTVLDFIQKKFD